MDDLTFPDSVLLSGVRLSIGDWLFEFELDDDEPDQVRCTWAYATLGDWSGEQEYWFAAPGHSRPRLVTHFDADACVAATTHSQIAFFLDHLYTASPNSSRLSRHEQLFLERILDRMLGLTE